MTSESLLIMSCVAGTRSFAHLWSRSSTSTNAATRMRFSLCTTSLYRWKLTSDRRRNENISNKSIYHYNSLLLHFPKHNHVCNVVPAEVICTRDTFVQFVTGCVLFRLICFSHDTRKHQQLDEISA